MHFFSFVKLSGRSSQQQSKSIVLDCMREKPARASKPCEIYIFTNSDDLTEKETKKVEKKNLGTDAYAANRCLSLSPSPYMRASSLIE